MDRNALLSLPRKDLQVLAKKYNIRANGSNATMIDELLACVDAIEPLNTSKKIARTEQSRGVHRVDDDVPDQNQSSTNTQDLSLSLAALKLRNRVFGASHTPTTDATTLPGPAVGSVPAATPPTVKSTTPETKKVPSLSLNKLPSIKLSTGPGTSRKPTARASGGSSSGAGSQTYRTPDTVQAKDSGPVHSTFDTTSLPAVTNKDQSKCGQEQETEPVLLWGMEPLMVQLRSMVGLDVGASAARAGAHQPGQSGLALPPLQGHAVPSRTVVLTGPAGNGKRSMVQTLAQEMGVRCVSVDLCALLSSSESEKAGDRVRHTCQEVMDMITMKNTPTVLMINDLGALAMPGDRILARACCRAKAELTLGLGQIRSAAVSKAGKRVRVVIVSIVHSNRDADSTLISIFLNESGTESGILQVPQANRSCREAILYQVMCKAEAELTAAEMDTLASVTEGMSAQEIIHMCDLASSTAASVPTPVSQVHCVSALAALGVEMS